MKELQIKHMVDRFLGWRLPENFNPDGGISFKPIRNEKSPWPAKNEPTGTNLLDATQAEQMVRYMVAEMPEAALSRSGEGTDAKQIELNDRLETVQRRKENKEYKRSKRRTR